MRLNKRKKQKSLNPIFTILILTFIIMIVSLLFSVLGIEGHKSTIVNDSLESSLTTVKNIFSLDGIHFLFGNIVNSFTTFEPLAYLVLSLIGISIGSASGLFQKLFSPLKKLRLSVLTFVLLLVSIISNIIGEYSFMLLIPLAGVMYQYAGKNPMLGVMTAFLGTSIGYGTNIIFTYDDYALGMLTQVAANATVDENYVFDLFSTSIIGPVSTFILAFIGTIIITKFLAPKLPKKCHLDDEVVYKDSKVAARISGVLFILIALVIGYMIIPGLPGSGALLDHNETEYIAQLFSPNAPFRTGIILFITIILVLCSFIYGIISGNLKSTEDCGLGLSKEFKNVGYLFVLLFFVSNMLAILNWTNLGSVITTRLVDFISTLQISGMPLIIAVFILIIIASILIPGNIEKWTLLSPIVIPLFMRANITPDFTQVLFKAADGIGKSISLFFVYFIIMVGFLQKYNAERKEEITLFGTLKILFPSILLFTIVWILIIIGWYLVGLPLGMNTMPTLQGGINMSLTAGIVGLPNVGKSTLFNAITKKHILAANYPFATIEPNVGVVTVPDHRLDVLTELVHPARTIPTTFEFTDIAGLVKGASTGEGLGNKFLSHIREVDAIVEVVRCFEDGNITHVEGKIDPIRDIEIIHVELILADLEVIDSRLGRLGKKAEMTKDKDTLLEVNLMKRLKENLEKNIPARALEYTEDELKVLKSFNLLTMKPIIYVSNVKETEILEENEYVQQVKEYAQKEKAEVIVVSAKIEEELSELEEEDKNLFLQDLGLQESGLDQLIRATYSLLGLATYFTEGTDEVRAWTFKKGMKAPECAGIIHTDFEKGFIKAEVMSYEDFAELKSEKAVREAGKLRLEGKDYIMQDGDICLFRFNV